MKRFILVSALVFVGCQHARREERAEPPQAEKQKPAPRKTPEPDAGKGKAADKQEKKTEPEETKDDRPRLSADAVGLFLPDGPRLIQQALSKRGYFAGEHQTGELDEETAAALRRFQSDEKSPRTGYPDRETVRKLGLDVDQVFKATGDQKSSPGR